MTRRALLVAVLLAAAVAGCGNDGDDSAASPAGAGTDGSELFARTVLAGNAGCITCHSLEPDRVLIGPSLAGIGTVAAERKADTSATAYLRESIVDPDAFIVDGFRAGVMPGDYTDGLDDAAIDALVDYLLTLTS